jgi:tubulin polyglutamylase TTLL6/13
VQVLRPHQVVSIVPGCLCISRKTSLVRTLLNCYGPGLAFSLVPRTFKLPDELDSWAAWLQQHPEQVRCVQHSDSTEEEIMCAQNH